MRELQQNFDVVIQDEAAQSKENETLIPLTATTTVNGAHRLYYLGFGDERQLHGLDHTKTMMVNANIRKLSPFDPDVLAQSFFERLINEGRVMHAFLDTQYRMHPAISRITSVPFYQYYFRCPLPLSIFLTPYNQPDVNRNGFHPMTFIDTSGITGKEETSAEPGHYVNEVEATIVANIINTLHSLVPVEELDSEIAVIAPYRSQVERISYVISRQVRACNTCLLYTSPSPRDA